MEEQGEKGLWAKWVNAAIVGCLFLFAIAASISIAATQTVWLLGMLFWVVRFAIRPRPKLYRTPVDYLLLGFFILTGLSAFLSYEPIVSIGKLRAASLFTIVYLVAQNVPSRRVLRLLAFTLIGSCVVSVFYTAGERVWGRGVKVQRVSQASPLYQAGVRDGDTILAIDKRRLRDPQELVNALSKPDKRPVIVSIYRHELLFRFEVSRGTLLAGSTAPEQLGIEEWSRGRDWRASGFFGHYVSYAEVLQMVFALTLGLFVSLPTKRSRAGIVLLIALVCLFAALLLTITRGVWLGCLCSSALILLLTLRRRTMILISLLAIPVILAGLFLLQQKRNVRFLDPADHSTTWRAVVWREGFHLLISNPRHLLVGVGMDSLKAHWREWGLFDGGKLPMGHMHSNILQIALERGIPVLLLWLAFLFVYARTSWRLVRQAKVQWIDRGILLGSLGGLVGFLVSGLAHYNWGDSEVVMVLYFIMGLSLALSRDLPEGASDVKTS